MKRLILVRHAKSDWGDASLSDRDRPLNARGERDAPAMANRFWRKYHAECSLFVSSPAVRATQTAHIFRKSAEAKDISIRFEPRIYEAPLNQLVQVVSELPDSHSCIALFGHNPGFSRLVEYFTGEWVDMPTCSVAAIEAEVDQWSAMGRGTGVLVDFDYPKKEIS